MLNKEDELLAHNWEKIVFLSILAPYPSVYQSDYENMIPIKNEKNK